MENFVRDDTRGTIEDVDAKFELLQRGQYVLHVKPADTVMVLDKKIPLELYEARNAVRIARWTAVGGRPILRSRKTKSSRAPRAPSSSKVSPRPSPR